MTTLFFGILAISNPANAISLIGNYSSTNDLSNFSVATTQQLVIGFTLPTGSDYTLDSIKLRLGSYNTTNGDVALLQIYQDLSKNSADPNGATLQSFLFINPSSSSETVNNFTFTPASTFTFLADTRYWLLVDATPGEYAWNQNDPPVTPTGISGITNLSSQFSFDNGSSYFNIGSFASFDIQVTQVVPTSVPFDFDPSFGVAFLGGGWLLRKHIKKKSTKV